MGLTWNSWYNPLDNVANVGKTFANTLSGGMYGGSYSDPTGGYAAANTSGGSTYDQAVNKQYPSTGTQVVLGDPNDPASASSIGLDYSAPSGSTGGTAPAGYSANQLNWINQSYDTKKAGLQSQLNTLDPQRQAAERNINQGYGSALEKLNVSNEQGTRNLNFSQQQVEGNRERNLKYLRDWMRNQTISKANQLGAMGAGDSSAMGLVNFALGQQAGTERANTMGNASDQLTQIGFQRDDLQTAFNQQRTALDEWKATNMNEIATKFSQLKAQIQNEMQQADADRLALLAEQDASLTQQAIAALQQLDTNYAQQAQELTGLYNKQFQVDPAFGQAASAFKAQNFGVSPESFNLPQAVNPEAPALAVRRRDEYGNII